LAGIEIHRSTVGKAIPAAAAPPPNRRATRPGAYPEKTLDLKTLMTVGSLATPWTIVLRSRHAIVFALFDNPDVVKNTLIARIPPDAVSAP
jgi:hypothetical protein